MHLDQQVAARGDDPSNALRIHHGQGSGHPATKEVLVGIEPEIAETLVTEIGVLGIQRGGRAGVSMPRMAWWAMAWLPGMTSSDRTVMSVSKFRGQNKDLVLVGHVAFVRERLLHGHHEVRISHLAVPWEIRQPWVVGRIPSGLPASTHALSVSISSALNTRSPTKWLYFGSGVHGGM